MVDLNLNVHHALQIYSDIACKWLKHQINVHAVAAVTATTDTCTAITALLEKIL